MLHSKHSIAIICTGTILFSGVTVWLFERPESRPGTTVLADEIDVAASKSESTLRQRLKKLLPARPSRIVRTSWNSGSGEAYPIPAELQGVDLSRQTPEMARAKSKGCVHCHAGSHDPHMKKTVQLGCTDCHGGNAAATEKALAHVTPLYPQFWKSSANPVRSYTLLNRERPEFVRFVNPGDLRIAHLSCGNVGCHPQETLQVKKSMMTHGCMLWGSALYNNGTLQLKWPIIGESYTMNGSPQAIFNVPQPTPEQTQNKGILPFLLPLPPYQIVQPGNVLRIFERGGRFIIEPGIPERLEEPGRPRNRLSNRGLGTLNRTDPVAIAAAKTRLLDPTLNFLGTNDQAGDYRSSGCTSCHIVYANDRSPIHSGPYAKYGNRGKTAAMTDGFVTNVDPMIPQDEFGHPITHRFTKAIPTSQCIVCHIHPGTTVMNSYLGYLWWDQETDGELIYPPEHQDPTSEQFVRSEMANPHDAASRSYLSDPEFLANVTDLNTQTKHTQFADFHGHGWVYRAIYKKNREGILLDSFGTEIHNVTNKKLRMAMLIPQYVKQLYKGQRSPNELARMEAELDEMRKNVPVHLMDVHLEKGMHCIDCHFVQDVHGNGNLYGEVRAAIEIQCIDCHGTVSERAFQWVGGRPQMRTSGPSAKGHDRAGVATPEEKRQKQLGRVLTAMVTPFGKRRFEIRGENVIQNSMVEPDLSWQVTQVVDTIDPNKPDTYNALAALSKTVRVGANGKMTWGDVPQNVNDCAHANQNMSCIACHSSWNPSCYGCHLVQKADKKMPELHNEGDITKNYTSYNFQTLRDEVYMLGRDGNVTGNRIGPVRSACAIHVGSYNGNREAIYFQQQTISAEGMSGIAFSSNVPHTVGGKGTTKLCTDCHLSRDNDNNALIAQLMMQGTNYLNLIGRFAWIASGHHGIFAAAVTERSEPQSVIGSSMHRLAYPEHYREHVNGGRMLKHAHEHPGNDIIENITRPFKKTEILDLQHRGEYIYTACGKGGMRIFDIAFLDHKGFAERIVTAPVSPFGQRFYVRSKFATSVAAPSTIAPDPTRTHNPANHERTVHPLYGYIYFTDKYEGLILVGAATLLDGNPTNNFVRRALTYNPDGLLKGATHVNIVGTYAYVCCEVGLVVINIDDPLKPFVSCIIDGRHLHHPTCSQVQFRYAFVCDEEGVKILDATDPGNPKPVSKIDLPEAKMIYVARTYAYVAGGEHGLIILDVKDPLRPAIDQIYNGDGCMNDVHDVQLGITYNSEFAYVADGKNGLRVVQLTSPNVPGNNGFSPRPRPQLVATYKIPKGGEALAISKGVDRDRAVDESGNQIAVFGRVGAGPLTLQEQQKLYLKPDKTPWTVIDGRRDYGIRDALEREKRLHLNLEGFYGPSRHPSLRRNLIRQVGPIPIPPRR